MKSILKIIFSFSCLLLTVKTDFAQTYFELIAGGQGEEICTEAMVIGSRYVFTGHTTSTGNGSYDIFVLQTDESGNLLHQTILGGPAEDIPLSATLTKDKKIVMTGYTNSFSSDQPFLCKVDTSGAFILEKHLAIGGWGHDVCQADGNNLFMTGYAGSSDPDIFLVKLDSAGNVIWSSLFGDSLINEGRKVIATKDGGAVVCGLTHVQNGGPLDIAVVKADRNGNLEWAYAYSCPGFYGWDHGYALLEYGSDLVIGSLSYSPAFNPNPNSPDAAILILDSLGTVKSGFALGSIDYDDVRDIIALPNGHLALTGSTNYGTHGQTDLLFAEIDTSGNIIQQQAFGGSSYETGLSVKSLGSGNYLLAGYTESFGQGFNDMYIIKTGTGVSNCNGINPGIQITPMMFTKTNTLEQHPASLVTMTGGFTVTGSTVPFQKLCTITNVPEELPGNNFLFRINYTSGQPVLHMKLERSEKLELTLCDITGKDLGCIANTVFQRGENEFTPNMMGLGKGMYVIRISGSVGNQAVKFVWD